MRSGAVYKTRQREYLLACMMKSAEHHMTADELAERLRKNGTPVGKSTVYRYLNVLVNEGLVRKYQVQEGMPACYQYTGERCHAHYHLKCEQCGELLHAHDDLPESIAQKLQSLYGFELNGDKTLLYGRCKQCGQTRKAET